MGEKERRRRLPPFVIKRKNFGKASNEKVLIQGVMF